MTADEKKIITGAFSSSFFLKPEFEDISKNTGGCMSLSEQTIFLAVEF